MAQPIFILDIGPDGVVATHPGRVELPRLVAPVPDERLSRDFNAVRAELMAIGCMRLNEKPGFEFDSSLIGPSAAPRFTKFAELMKALRQRDPEEKDRFPPCSIFGHADPTGTDAYNKKLSGRRAKAVYATLVRDVKIWDKLFLNPHGNDKWTFKAIQLMLSVSLKPGEPPFFVGPIDGAKTAETQKLTREALKAYQEARKLPKTGFANDATRARLFEEYMDFLCHDAEGNRFVLDAKTDFIAARKHPGLKGDVQGCGEFNPIFLPTKEDQERFDKAKTDDEKEERNIAFAETRRVIVYAFRHGTEIDPNKWPCPVAEEDPAACRNRFWSDHKVRLRREPEVERRFPDSRDTMACRFYHAFAFPSPCEAGIRRWRVRFRADHPDVRQPPIPLVDRRFAVTVGSAQFAPVMRGRTDPDGEIVIPVLDEKGTITVKLDAWGAIFEIDSKKRAKADPREKADEKDETAAGQGFDTDKFPDEDTFMVFTLDAGALLRLDEEEQTAAKQRLYNLGFGKNAPASWTKEELDLAVRQYRRTRAGRRGVTEGDGLDPVTIESLRLEHDVEGPPPPSPPDDDE
jgi:hypothetical protein